MMVTVSMCSSILMRVLPHITKPLRLKVFAHLNPRRRKWEHVQSEPLLWIGMKEESAEKSLQGQLQPSCGGQSSVLRRMFLDMSSAMAHSLSFLHSLLILWACFSGISIDRWATKISLPRSIAFLLKLTKVDFYWLLRSLAGEIV